MTAINLFHEYYGLDFDLYQCFLNIFAATLTFGNGIDMLTMILADLIQKMTALNEEQLATVIASFKPVVAKKNELLLEYGAVANRLFFINRGCLRLYYCNNDQSIITRFMAFENTFLTSIVSFISGEPSTEYIQALETSELLVITYEDFSYLRKTIPGWDKMYIYILEYGLTVITSKLGNLLTQSAAERYRNLLKNNPKLIQRLSNSNLAAYMNISPETLSRLKSQI
ncbi:Crp/Fnr family transcriptional regulator [Pedobacter panaciterrae]|uniref:Crp/Fnr family transcriptional regulator n=1 Tax=Pedobacter panaciterrae TaxID=363849 RepID=UPI002597D0E4|nr:Crp/Fnr family transcriptional regulator [uncultured Pedobacter sp.]